MIPNGYSSDRTGFGEPIQCWRSDFFDSMTVITLNAEMREIELRRRIGGQPMGVGLRVQEGEPMSQMQGRDDMAVFLMERLGVDGLQLLRSAWIDTPQERGESLEVEVRLRFLGSEFVEFMKARKVRR